MTGLERLRDLVDGMIEWSVYTIMNEDWLSRNGVNACSGRVAMKELLCEIADQIECETAHDHSKDVSMSAYDLLPDCDREAISLALDCGGVEEIKKRLMPEGMEWPKVDGKPVDFKTAYGPSLGVLEAVSIYNTGACQVMSHDGIIKSAKDIHIVKPKVLDADGVEIREGDTVYSIETGEPVTVNCVEGGNPWFGTTTGTIRHCSKFTHRAPVLAADGKQILKGDVLYDRAGNHFEVLENPENDQHVIANFTDEDGKVHRTFTKAQEFTHENPVLAADGLALREGEEVWDQDGNKYEVTEIGGENVIHVEYWDCGLRTNGVLKGGQLTHERPDSWERLEDDADALLKAESNGKGSYNAANDYCNAHGLGTDGTVWVLMARDLVRRAKKLAGVSE